MTAASEPRSSFRLPAVIEPFRDDETPVSTVDIAPTILRLCGLEVPPEWPGLNLLDRQALQQREAIFGATFLHDAVDVHHPASSLMYRWCIEGWWKLILPLSRACPAMERSSFTTLKDDPREEHNLAEREPEVVHRLRKRIETWWPAR